jgi:acetylornithine deacetylase/succinyl-diaminopimelate desuccinylase-like protein
MIEGGHAPNALPQHVKASVKCRIMPGTPVADVQAQIVKVIADDAIKVSPKGEGGVLSPMPPLTDAIVGPVRKVAESIWPGVVIVPTMLTGYTDGKYLNPAGVPTYGLSGLFEDAEGNYIHGLNERMRVKSMRSRQHGASVHRYLHRARCGRLMHCSRGCRGSMEGPTKF